jgi:hypothetical protein
MKRMLMAVMLVSACATTEPPQTGQTSQDSIATECDDGGDCGTFDNWCDNGYPSCSVTWTAAGGYCYSAGAGADCANSSPGNPNTLCNNLVVDGNSCACIYTC